MPQKRNEPPPVMTWGRAAPVLVVAGLFDLVRAFFEFFWFFGPALAALTCTLKWSDTVSTWSLGFLGTKTTALVCTAGAGAVGVAGVEVTGPIGVIMAFAVGLLGWGTIGLWVIVTNARLFKDNAGNILRSLGGLLVSEVPIVGTLPALSFTTWRMYHTQIQTEKAAFKKWEKENAAMQAQERERQIARVMQIQAVQQQAANDEAYAEQAANDEKYHEEEIPEEERRAA